MDLKLRQREAAEQLGVHAQTYRRWEQGSRAPVVRSWPKVIQFLDYDPRPPQESLADRLKHKREGNGWSQAEGARSLGVSPAVLWRWESGRRKPKGSYLAKVYSFLGGDPRPWPVSIGARLRRHRESMGLTLAKLALRLGVAQSTLCRWESGEREPKGDYLAKAEKLLAL